MFNNREDNPNYFSYAHSIVDAKNGDYHKWTKWKRKLKRSVYEKSKVWSETLKEWMLYCGICKTPLYYEESTIDHIIPMAKGGSSFITNLQLTHYKCNQRKDAQKSPYFNRIQYNG